MQTIMFRNVRSILMKENKSKKCLKSAQFYIDFTQSCTDIGNKRTHTKMHRTFIIPNVQFYQKIQKETVTIPFYNFTKGIYCTCFDTFIFVMKRNCDS
jgi:hypothetical protein